MPTGSLLRQPLDAWERLTEKISNDALSLILFSIIRSPTEKSNHKAALFFLTNSHKYRMNKIEKSV